MADTLERIKNVDYNFNEKCWGGISKDAKELIINLLKKNYKERPSPGEALLSDWFQDVNIYPSTLVLLLETLGSNAH